MAFGFRRKGPDMTQRTLPALPSRRTTEKYNHEHHNLATEYVYGKQFSGTSLTFDEYIRLVRGFGVMAQTITLPIADEIDSMIDGAVSGDLMEIPASADDFERAYRDAILPMPEVIEAEEEVACELL